LQLLVLLAKPKSKQ